MESYHNIAFIGAGNLAWHLAPELENYGHKVSLVHSRTKKDTQSLINRLYKASNKKNLDFSNSQVDVIIISVNDNNIKEVVSDIVAPENCTLFHTSGTQPMELLKISAAENYGVIYPLQTFTKGTKVSLRDTPFFLEANSNYAYKVQYNLTKGITRQIYKINSDQRSTLHLAAVFGSNFSNHMISIAKSLMDERDMNFKLLQNVIFSMIQKAFEIGPENGQTGPAVREDHQTMEKHLKLLKGDKDMKKLYTIISNHIIKTQQQ